MAMAMFPESLGKTSGRKDIDEFNGKSITN